MADAFTYHDLAMHPVTRDAYVWLTASINGAEEAVVVTLTRDGKVTRFNLANLSSDTFIVEDPVDANANFWIVAMMIFLPFSSADFRSADRIAGATMFFTSEKSLMLSGNCLSSGRRSVTTITLPNSGTRSAFAPGRSARMG